MSTAPVHAVLPCACAGPRQHSLGAPLAPLRWLEHTGSLVEAQPGQGRVDPAPRGCFSSVVAVVELPPTKAQRAAALALRRVPALCCAGRDTAGTVVSVNTKSPQPLSPRATWLRHPLGYVESVHWVGMGAALRAQHSRHPPPPSSSICFPLLLVSCPACAACCCRARCPRAAWLCLSVCVCPRGLQLCRSLHVPCAPAALRRGCAQPAPLCSQAAG